MTKKIKYPFYVIIDDVNKGKFVKYDVMQYLVACYKDTKKTNRPVSFDNFREFVENKSRYMYWSRCEYEIVLTAWASNTIEQKIDVHWQIMNNIDAVTHLLMKNVL